MAESDNLAEKFPGIYALGKLLLTKNLVPGQKVYGEQLVNFNGTEYRVWSPERSKLAAAIKNGLEKFEIHAGMHVLYLGAAEGTTVSHISDIVGEKGIVVGIDISARTMRRFLFLCEKRQNLLPIMGDAAQPLSYKDELGAFKADLLYQDISQRNQAEIFLRNARQYLKAGGMGMLAIKARSISSAGSARKIFDGETEKLKKEFGILQRVSLAPYDKFHEMVFCRRK
ncbi:MAG: fibrillarin-like rRNA/tRNA 2'-O-methyltransferase [Candidatus Diapherotrites archaeon]